MYKCIYVFVLGILIGASAMFLTSCAETRMGAEDEVKEFIERHEGPSEPSEQFTFFW